MNRGTERELKINLDELATAIMAVTLHLRLSQASYEKGKTRDRTLMNELNEEFLDIKGLRLIGMRDDDFVVNRAEF